jgi:predicted nucleic acid-binding protein
MRRCPSHPQSGLTPEYLLGTWWMLGMSENDFQALVPRSRPATGNPEANRSADTESQSPLLYSPVTVAELWAGARPNEHDALNSLFRALTCIPIDEETGHHAGVYMSRYRRSHGIELADALIAARAVSKQSLLHLDRAPEI